MNSKAPRRSPYPYVFVFSYFYTLGMRGYLKGLTLEPGKQSEAVLFNNGPGCSPTSTFTCSLKTLHYEEADGLLILMRIEHATYWILIMMETT